MSDFLENLLGIHAEAEETLRPRPVSRYEAAPGPSLQASEPDLPESGAADERDRASGPTAARPTSTRFERDAESDARMQRSAREPAPASLGGERESGAMRARPRNLRPNLEGVQRAVQEDDVEVQPRSPSRTGIAPSVPAHSVEEERSPKEERAEGESVRDDEYERAENRRSEPNGQTGVERSVGERVIVERIIEPGLPAARTMDATSPWAPRQDATVSARVAVPMTITNQTPVPANGRGDSETMRPRQSAASAIENEILVATQAPQPMRGAQSEPQPVIQVTIGRIEVRASTTATAPARKRAPAEPQTSLEEYMRQRKGGAR